MNNDVLDELEVIQSIFCAVNELDIEPSGRDTVVTIRLDSKRECKLMLILPETYPKELPEISLQASDLTRTETERLTSELRNAARKFQGEPMVLHIATFCNELLLSTKPGLPTSEAPAEDPATDRIMILHLDHMRSKASYVKTLLTWSQEFALRGFLLFCQKWIFLLLQSDAKNLRNYLKQHRTQNVDVDSTGRPCKERLLKILFEAPALDCQTPPLPPFSVHEFSQETQLSQFMELHKCAMLYSQYIQPVMQRNY